MYQYVVSKEIPPFSLYMPHLRSLLVFSNDSLAQYSHALIIVEVEEQSYDQKVLDLFSDATASIHVCHNLMHDHYGM